jgi:cyclase
VKTIRCLTLTGLAIFATMALIPAQVAAQPGQVKLVVPGVWFREGDLQNAGQCNNIIIEMKDYLIVVDANYPSGAQAMIETTQRISNKPVKYVILTHHHGDHVYGSSLWTKHGAITVAHAGVAEEMQRFEPARWQSAIKQRPDVAALRLAVPEPPQQTFDRSPYVIKDGGREVRIYHFGWAHTRGDAFVYLPKEKVLCTGDAVVNGPYNFTGDADIGNWPKAIRQAQILGAVHVLPGHGPAGGPEVMEGQARFLNELHKEVDSLIRQGKKLEDVVTPETSGVPAKTSVTLPSNVKNWIGSQLPSQVRDAWEEVVQKKPHGDIPH